MLDEAETVDGREAGSYIDSKILHEFDFHQYELHAAYGAQFSAGLPSAGLHHKVVFS